MPKYKFYWLDKTTNEVEGATPTEALTRRFGNEALSALDYWEEIKENKELSTIEKKKVVGWTSRGPIYEDLSEGEMMKVVVDWLRVQYTLYGDGLMSILEISEAIKIANEYLVNIYDE